MASQKQSRQKTVKPAVRSTPTATSRKRVLKWLAAALIVGALGNMLLALLMSIAASMMGPDGVQMFWHLMMAIIGLYLIFLIGFLIIGKFGLLKLILPVVTGIVLVAQVAVSALIHQTPVQPAAAPMSMDAYHTWVAFVGMLYVTAAFLVVATGATLTQTVLKRQSHTSRAIIGLTLVFILSLLVIFL